MPPARQWPCCCQDRTLSHVAQHEPGAAPAWMKLSLSSILRKQSRPMLASSALWGLAGLSTKLWISCPCSKVSTRTAGVTRGYSALGKLRLRHSLHAQCCVRVSHVQTFEATGCWPQVLWGPTAVGPSTKLARSCLC